MEMKEPRTWSKLKTRLLRRIDSESTTRRLLLECDVMRCYIPRGVFRELREVPAFQESLDIMIGLGHLVEQRYVQRKSGRGNPIGFSKVFKPRLEISMAREDLVDYVMSIAERYGFKINRVDAESIALAIEKNAVLVTADRNQALLADKLGLRVLFTIPRPRSSGVAYV